YPRESDREQKNRKRCLRRIALKTATEQIQTEYSDKMTTADMNQRKKDIVRRMDRFSRELIDRARGSLATEGQGTTAPSNEDEGADPDIDMAEEEENVPKPDAEELFATDGTTNLVEQNDQDVDHGEQASEVPYHEIVRHALEILLEDEKPKLPDQVFPDCVADETIGEQQKARLWQCEDLQELEESIPVPGHPNILLGGPSTIPELQEHIVKTGIGHLMRVEDIPPRMPISRGGIKYGKWPTTVEDIMNFSWRRFLLENHRDKVVFVPIPGTDGNMPTDKLGVNAMLRKSVQDNS
ncbi:hypothetical protein BDP81DRAFT_488804, partial [Colletotrichum phormii]